MFVQAKHALDFFQKHVRALDMMVPADTLVKGGTAFCMANVGDEYLVYMPSGPGGISLTVAGDHELQLWWFNPRTGGSLVAGRTLPPGPASHPLGEPPDSPTSDWAVLVSALPRAGLAADERPSRGSVSAGLGIAAASGIAVAAVFLGLVLVAAALQLLPRLRARQSLPLPRGSLAFADVV